MDKHILILVLLASIILSMFTACTKTQVKYVYIKQKCPTLQTIKPSELNLSNESNDTLQLHIKVKDAK